MPPLTGAGFDLGAAVAQLAFQVAAHREFLFHHQRSEFAADAAVEGAGRDVCIGVRRQDRFELAVYASSDTD